MILFLLLVAVLVIVAGGVFVHPVLFVLLLALALAIVWSRGGRVP